MSHKKIEKKEKFKFNTILSDVSAFTTFFKDDIEKQLEDAFEKGGTFTVYPKGTSMLPTLKEGRDSVELSKVKDAKVNCIYLYKRPNGEYVLHRLLKITKDFYIFSGDNQLVIEKVQKGSLIAFVSHVWRGKKSKGEKGCSRLFLKLNSVYFFRKLFIRLRALKKKLRTKRS